MASPIAQGPSRLGISIPALEGTGPLHRQLYQAVRRAILSGDIAPGTRLPSTRALAADLGLSRTTTQLAFEQLIAEGYLEGRVGSGTFVNGDLEGAGLQTNRPERTSARDQSSSDKRDGRAASDRDGEVVPLSQLSQLGERLRSREVMPLLSAAADMPRPTIDFRHGLPPLHDFPHAQWRRLVTRQLRRTDVELYDYGPAAGATVLRRAVAAYLRRSRGLVCSEDEIVITGGSQRALDLLARVLLDPGDGAVVEDPGYEGARSAFLLVGARVVAAPVDRDGINVEAIAPDALQGLRLRLAYVTPSHQYPLGSILPLQRRLKLLEWAAARDVFVIEDDYDGEFRFGSRPISPLQTLDRSGRVLYVGTFSKVMFPSLRLGYIVAPRGLAATLARAKALSDGGSSALEQHAVAKFLDSGSFERYLRRARLRMHERRKTLVEALDRHFGDEVEVVGGPAGVHVVARFKNLTPAQIHQWVRAALAKDLGVYTSTPYYYASKPVAGELVLGYASMEPSRIRRGIARLAEVLGAMRSGTETQAAKPPKPRSTRR